MRRITAGEPWFPGNDVVGRVKSSRTDRALRFQRSQRIERHAVVRILIHVGDVVAAVNRFPFSRFELFELGDIVFAPVGIAVGFELVRVAPRHHPAGRHDGDVAIFHLRQRRRRRRIVPDLHRQLAVERLVVDFLEQHIDRALCAAPIGFFNAV